MHKIAIITDAHANLPALQTALQAIQGEDCQAIYHLGDAIDIGPFPAECVDLFNQTPNLHCLLGNHELYYLNGLPSPQPEWMSDGEVEHHIWTNAQLGEGRRPILAGWPMALEMEIEGLRTVFVHYGLNRSGRDFLGVVRRPDRADLDRLFDRWDADLVFFGHDHAPTDLEGSARYLNPGSLGCSQYAVARYIVATFQDGQVDVRHRGVPYDDGSLIEAFEDREVPEREFIHKVFFWGRFG